MEGHSRPSGDHPLGTFENLVLTYHNDVWTDGAGAQLQRIYGTYAVSRLLGARYLHSPLFRVDYQGLSALEETVNDPSYHDAFNELCWIDSDVLPTDVFRTMEVANLTTEVLEGLATVPGNAGGAEGMWLLKVTLPYGIADRFPDCYEVCKEVSPFASVPRRGRPLRVAIHVRQGDLLVVDSHRMLPHGYFVAVAQRVAAALDAVGVDYRMELHTELPTREFTVTPGHLGIVGDISAPVVLRPEMSSLDEFSVLPNLGLFVNERAIDCLRKLATADILVMSRSSFSYLAAILNRNGVVLYHPFWHSGPSSWIPVGPNGDFDQLVLQKAAQAP
jgi:hypothetical protein